jgi:GntR family transcriptional regulator, rspAB operon transcriptional repressor
MLAEERVQFAQIDPSAPIARQVCRALRERIIRNDLKPDQKVSEAEIAAQYGISRQPVREAFIRLSAEGLVAILPQRGTRVRLIDVAAVREARFIREAVEADIVSLLAGAPLRVGLAELREHVARQYEIAGRDPVEFIRADEDFHRALARMAGKAGVWQKVQGLKAQMDRVRFLSLDRFPVRKLVDQHGAIVDGIAAGDIARTETALRLHLREVLADLPQIVRANPDFFDSEVVGIEDQTVSIPGGEEI